ncbi:MAG: DtxR family transcriptional regulator [Clostridia bacterium]|nr:DtxR family transcriptional regulator [Clostridia bacterium]
MEVEKFHTVRGYQLLEQNKKLLTPAMEDYLEMIYRNSLVEEYMRVNTLSELLNVQAPSATKMVQKLHELGLIHYKKYGIIFLTENGREIGKYLLERHNILEKFLRILASGDSLLIETELIEHSISPATLDNIRVFITFWESNPEIISQFEAFKEKLFPKTAQ